MQAAWGAEGAAAVQPEWCKGAVDLPPAPARRWLRLESWLHPHTSLFPAGAPVWVLLGVLQNWKPVPGRYTTVEWRRTKRCRKGRSKGLWSQHHVQEVEVFHCVPSSETKSQYFRQTVTSPKLMGPPSCEALAVVTVLLCQSCAETAQKQLLLFL